MTTVVYEYDLFGHKIYFAEEQLPVRIDTFHGYIYIPKMSPKLRKVIPKRIKPFYCYISRDTPDVMILEDCIRGKTMYAGGSIISKVLVAKTLRCHDITTTLMLTDVIIGVYNLIKTSVDILLLKELTTTFNILLTLNGLQTRTVEDFVLICKKLGNNSLVTKDLVGTTILRSFNINGLVSPHGNVYIRS